MIHLRISIASLIAVAAVGCASPERQVSDLSAPPAPRLNWQSARNTEPPVKVPLAQDLVIREHRFVSHSAELNSDGEDQVLRLASCLSTSPAKIVIEPSVSGAAILSMALPGKPDKSVKLDQQRRQYVIQKLLTLGVPDAESRVILQTSPAA